MLRKKKIHKSDSITTTNADKHEQQHAQKEKKNHLALTDLTAPISNSS